MRNPYEYDYSFKVYRNSSSIFLCTLAEDTLELLIYCKVESSGEGLLILILYLLLLGVITSIHLLAEPLLMGFTDLLKSVCQSLANFLYLALLLLGNYQETFSCD